MANSPNTNLRAALVQGLLDMPVGLPTQYPNMPFEKPSAQEPWARAFILPNTPYVATLGAEGEDGHDGIMQVDLNYPLETGEADVMSKADQFDDFFKAGKRLVHGGVSLTVTSCGRSDGREVDGWYRVSISVAWTSRVARN